MSVVIQFDRGRVREKYGCGCPTDEVAAPHDEEGCLVKKLEENKYSLKTALQVAVGLVEILEMLESRDRS